MTRIFETAPNVGAILYTSWGYDQTNIDYFKVVERRGKSTVVLQKCKARRSTVGRPDSMVYETVPTDDLEPEQFVRRLNKHGTLRVENYMILSPWDGTPKQGTSYA